MLFICLGGRTMNFFEELQWRGLVKDVTDEESLKERIQSPMTVYCGFDPTADSLHIGHLQQILLLRRYQLAGHKPIALCGGATGMIGDPRPTTERKLLSLEDVAYNVECIRKQLSHFLDFDASKPNCAVLENNYNWLGEMNILEFLRDYGKHFNISYMISKDIIASRLQSGISFTEFTYTILQAADFLHLYQNYNCEMQIGGSDQWGNLVSGTDLIRKICGDKAKVYGVTSPLITKSDGSKFGKSEGGNVWLDPQKTSAYQFYQFWVNVSDDDIESLLKRLSCKSVEEIEALIKSKEEAPYLRQAQKALAEELTLLVHGEEGLESAKRITKTLFDGEITKLSFDEMKEALHDAPSALISDGQPLADTLVEAGIAKSKREAREWIRQGSIQVNGSKVQALDFIVKKEDAFNQKLTIIKKGKRSWFVCEYKE